MTSTPPLQFSSYTVLMGVGIFVSALLWWRWQRREGDSRLKWIYSSGLLGALAGAKLSFLIAEGWLYYDNALALWSGRSITGGLLGGYLGVELAKKGLGYRSTTGDRFAILVPISIGLGRIGCLFEGCCLGIECDPHWWTVTDAHLVDRWPAPWVEVGFNGLFLVWVLVATRQNWASSNRFHAYLIAYGGFRFFHEFLRENVRVAGPFSGYHAITLFMVGFALVRYRSRRSTAPSDREEGG